MSKNIPLPIVHGISLYSLIVTLALDWLWALPEAGLSLSIVALPLVACLVIFLFIICSTTVGLIQHNVAHDEWKVALIKGSAMGIIAAVPFPVVGTILGIGAGLILLQKRTDKQTIQLGTLTQEWRILENILRRSLPVREQQMNIEAVINFWHGHGLISVEEKRELHNLRMERNKATHSDSPPEDLSAMIERLSQMNHALRRRFNRIA